MEGQIPESVKSLRSSILQELEREMSRSYRQKYLHKRAEVLFEEEKQIGGRNYQTGHTREYIRAAAQMGGNLSGKVIDGVLTDFLEPDILLFQP